MVEPTFQWFLSAILSSTRTLVPPSAPKEPSVKSTFTSSLMALGSTPIRVSVSPATRAGEERSGLIALTSGTLARVLATSGDSGREPSPPMLTT